MSMKIFKKRVGIKNDSKEGGKKYFEIFSLENKPVSNLSGLAGSFSKAGINVCLERRKDS